MLPALEINVLSTTEARRYIAGPINSYLIQKVTEPPDKGETALSKIALTISIVKGLL